MWLCSVRRLLKSRFYTTYVIYTSAPTEMFSFSLLQVRASNRPVLEIDNARSLVEKITSDNYALFLTFATIFDS